MNINDHWLGFLICILAKNEEQFYQGYKLATAGRKPGKIWKDCNKKELKRK